MLVMFSEDKNVVLGTKNGQLTFSEKQQQLAEFSEVGNVNKHIQTDIFFLEFKHEPLNCTKRTLVL